jgi:hypothetical protein
VPIEFLQAGSILGQFAMASFAGLSGIPPGTTPVVQYTSQSVRLNFV